MFAAKKLISLFLMPIPMVLMLGFIALILLFFTRRQRLGKGLALCSMTLLAIVSYGPTANQLIRPLENQYPPFDLSQRVEFVAVLGNGNISDPRLTISEQLSYAGKARLLEGMRIYNANAGSKLIVSGYQGLDSRAYADAAAEFLQFWGVAKADIMIEPEPRDTEEEAQRIRQLVQQAPFALVSSAAHLPRAMQFFADAPNQPIAAPSDYLVKLRAGEQQDDYRFRAEHLAKSESASHEYLGQWWAAIKSF